MGVGLRKYDFDNLDAAYIAFPGTMLIQGLKMLVIPLVVFSIIAGVSRLERDVTGKIGGYACAYYAVTTFLAVILGIILCAGIKPGVDRDNRGEVDPSKRSNDSSPVDTILDIIRQLLPPNIVYALFAQTKTWRGVNHEQWDCSGGAWDPETCSKTSSKSYDLSQAQSGFNSTLCDVTENDIYYRCRYSLKSGWIDPRANVLGILVFSIGFALAITRVENTAQRRSLQTFFGGVNEAIMKLIYIVIWYAPIGIIFLIASKIVTMTDVEETFRKLGLYMGTVIAGLAIHGLIVLPIIFIVGTKNFTLRAPLDYLKYVVGVSQALLNALATASSAATLPLTIKNLEDNNKIDPRISRLVLPIGATVNMDGTALYEAVAAIFLAQYEGLDLNFGDYVLISITSTVASVGAAGIPEAGLVTLLIVMTAIGLPADRVSLILVIDWLLDRFRTAMNVLGDSIGCAVVQANVKLEPLKGSEEDLDAVDNEA